MSSVTSSSALGCLLLSRKSATLARQKVRFLYNVVSSFCWYRKPAFKFLHFCSREETSRYRYRPKSHPRVWPIKKPWTIIQQQCSDGTMVDHHKANKQDKDGYGRANHNLCKLWLVHQLVEAVCGIRWRMNVMVHQVMMMIGNYLLTPLAYFHLAIRAHKVSNLQYLSATNWTANN